MEFLESMTHVHSKVTTKSGPVEYLGRTYIRWVATCGTCGDESYDCATEAIALRNLALTNYGGVRP